jgi:hypothetical protein
MREIEVYDVGVTMVHEAVDLLGHRHCRATAVHLITEMSSK